MSIQIDLIKLLACCKHFFDWADSLCWI